MTDSSLIMNNKSTGIYAEIVYGTPHTTVLFPTNSACFQCFSCHIASHFAVNSVLTYQLIDDILIIS